MPDDYTVRLTARQEGVEYRTGAEVYRFDVRLTEHGWELYLPGSRGEHFAPYELTEAEAAEILPRVVAHLATDRVLGIPVRTYPVRIQRCPTP